jgi:hypothetical protein
MPTPPKTHVETAEAKIEAKEDREEARVEAKEARIEAKVEAKVVELIDRAAAVQALQEEEGLHRTGTGHSTVADEAAATSLRELQNWRQALAADQ